MNAACVASGVKMYATARNAVAGWVRSSQVDMLRDHCRLSVYDVYGLTDDHIFSSLKFHPNLQYFLPYRKRSLLFQKSFLSHYLLEKFAQGGDKRSLSSS